jgi:hypothetical protein
MDTTKWKSVAVSIEVYQILMAMAKDNDRSVSRQLAHIVKKAAENKEAA